MDADPNFREGMHKAFVQVGLAPMHGDVVEAPDDVFFKQWSGNEPGAKLSAKACGAFVRLLKRQDDYHISLGDLADDSNFIQIGADDERDEDVRGHEEEDTEEEEEI